MLTVICPVLNEENYIENILDFFAKAEPFEKELIIVDGGSTDNTVRIVEEWRKKYNNIILLHNPKKYVPYALNIAIKNSKGDPIIRLDAHTDYSEDYFVKILEVFEETGADIVGGHMSKAGRTTFQKAVAHCTSSAFGIGDSKIHDSSFSGFTNHVYLGAWKRELFEQVGYFDEDMKRNQDDEFHYRAHLFGKKIFLSSKIISTYFPRSNIRKLFKQFFQYGLFKPLVMRKLRTIPKLRHVVPSLFVVYLITLCFFQNIYFSMPLLIYLTLSACFSFCGSRKFSEKLISPIIYFVLHFAYGSGFILGLRKLLF